MGVVTWSTIGHTDPRVGELSGVSSMDYAIIIVVLTWLHNLRINRPAALCQILLILSVVALHEYGHAGEWRCAAQCLRPHHDAAGWAFCLPSTLT
jgi:hypothetical protein